MHELGLARSIHAIVAEHAGGRPVRRVRVAVTWPMVSTGLVATSKTACGAARAIGGTMSAKTATFRASKSMRVSPGRWFTPAAITTTSHPSSAS